MPFADSDRFRGVHTMENGLALLYEVAPPLVIAPLAGAGEPSAATREASHRR